MSERWISPTSVFDGQNILKNAHLRIEDDRVIEVLAGDLPQGAQSQRISGLISPGFVDLQVNGGGDVMLNATPTSDGMRIMAEAHRRFGTVAIMPTVITDRQEVMGLAAEAALAAKGDRGILGIHIEGPHIAPERRGTHARKFVRPLDQPTLDIVGKLRDADLPVMITVAPESATPAQISKLAEMGAIVSLGHTDATSEQVKTAISAGATCATHLFNAMSPMVGRAAGAVGAVINSELYSGIICDGYHVADEMIGLAIRARPVSGRMFLVSDAMATVGGQDHFSLYGQDIYLKDGRLVNSEGSLAGAHVTQAQGVKRLAEHVGVSLLDALKMAVTIPAECMGVPEYGMLEGRRVDDLVILNAAHEFVGDLSAPIHDAA
ncbi:N-acetylglucosamine-6-phosphate deacetylase [Falsihalocynthiibacter sp. SS001]|uniref:N-acetylglucosamine-6-phosphate deacetylase n=1 Tax=Falsihalocynthiibacter sp. SS001 TaxID=3349698 RepID=UPI0036D3A74A